MKRSEARLKYGLDIVAQEDSIMLDLLGGNYYEGVLMTRTQSERLAKFYGVDPKKHADTPAADLMEAGAWRDTFRAAHHDGLRLIAYLAGKGLLEQGVDPVVSLGTMLEFLEGQPPEWDEED